MSCNRPLLAFQAFEKNGRGKRPINFSPGSDTHPVSLPCGQCIGCRLDRARSWAIRLHLEATQHDDACFVTLTYDEEHIPDGDSLIPQHLSDFMRKLRKSISPTRVRFYGVGEYGGQFDRPHYHIVLYGYNFPDRRSYIDRGDYTIDNSLLLSTIWKKGHATVQNFALECAAYVSKYAVKKITGSDAARHYEIVDNETGEIYIREPEFARMSRRPGIGSDWLKKYYSDLYPKGYVTDGKGVKIPPPEYFNKLYEKWFPEEMEQLRDSRKQEVFERYNDANIERMEAREKIQKAKLKLKGG